MKKKLTVVLLLWMLIFLPIFGGRAVTSLTAKADAVAAQGAVTHTVDFLLDGNEPTEVYKSLTVEEGKYLNYEDIPVSPAPLKNTEYFLFWTEDGTNAFSFANPITQDVTLTAKWARKGYIVQFLVNGKVFNEQLVAKDDSAVDPGEVTVIGYTFEGWGDPSAYENVTQDLQIEAVLTVQKYTATVYAPDGSSTKITDISHGDDVDLTQIDPPQIIGYLPWDGQSIEGNTQNVQSDVSLFLVYERQTFTARYEAPEADAWEVEEKAVVYGQTAPYSSKVPAKEGFMFVGWYVGEEPYTFTSAVTQDVTLTAKFVQLAKEKYTVQFLMHDGSVYSEQLVEEGSSAIEPGAPYREGYTFLGWSGDFSSVTAPTQIRPLYEINEYMVTVYFDGEVVFQDGVVYGGNVAQPNPADYQTPEGKEFLYFNGSFTDIRKDTEIHAVFRDKSYTVFFKSGNDRVGLPQTVTHGERAFVPVAPEKSGWEFLGWAVEGETIVLQPSADYTSAITEGCVFSAIYRQYTYTVNFYDGEELVHTVENILYGGFVPYKNLPHTEQAIFVGWYTESSCVNAYEFETPITGNLTLYALWTERPKEYVTVTFETEEGFYTSAVVEKNGTAREVAGPGKEGYEFKYWTLDGERFDFATKITENITLVAHFEAKSYTVIFKGLDGKVLKTETVTYGNGAIAPAAPELEEEGYDFKGWNTSFDEVKENLTVRANYEKKSYIVTFRNGEEISSQTVEHGGFLTIVTPQKEGHKFLGWYTAEEGGEKLSITSPVTQEAVVYARFEVNFYTLYYYYYGNDGVQRCIERTVAYGATIDWIDGEDIPADMASGRFDGWSVNGYSEPPQTMPAKSLTANAILRKTYAIEYFVGEWSKRVEVEEGSPLTTPADLQTIGYPFPTDKVVTFLGWDSSLPSVMPNHNLTLYANIQIKNYYTITYQINGQIYGEPVRVLEGEAIRLIDLPTQSYDEFIVNGWKNSYSAMPSQDIIIEADITRYYFLRYELNGEPFGTPQKLLPGDIVVTPLPTMQAWESFNGWQNVPDKMPDSDVVISGTTTSKKNYLSVEVLSLGDSRVELRVYVRGDVCMAGVVGKVYFVSELRTEQKEYFSEDGLGFIYVKEEKQGNFVWSSPDNVTEDILLISLVGEFHGNVEDLVVKVEIDQMVLIAEGGEIVPTFEYEIGK